MGSQLQKRLAEKLHVADYDNLKFSWEEQGIKFTVPVKNTFEPSSSCNRRIRYIAHITLTDKTDSRYGALSRSVNSAQTTRREMA